MVALSVMPAVAMAASLGGWMFFIQHQFERTYHAHHEDWDHHEAAIYGSSFFNMPALLRWCSSNVGLHHLHHLYPAIPNYRLMECLQPVPELANVNQITLRESLA